MRDAPPAHCTTAHRTTLCTPHSESLLRRHPLRAGRGESAASRPAPGPLHLARSRAAAAAAARGLGPVQASTAKNQHRRSHSWSFSTVSLDQPVPTQLPCVPMLITRQ